MPLVRRTSLVMLAFFAGGCCEELGACAQNEVEIVVTTGEQSVAVSIDGYDGFTCTPGEGMTVCTVDAIVDGDYELTVDVEGYDPQPITLAVRTNQAPPYSCECEVPRGSALIELDAPEPEPDAGAPDAGANDAG